MSFITYSDARKNFKRILDQVNDNKEAIVIARKNGNAVLLAEDEYNNLMETIYLLKSPENSKRLLESIEQLKNRQSTERDLLDE
ncbi:antitoxin YefM [Sinobaca qinghaiensis]|uniref:Antitoxin n=1 Tax=Sinobaca qinghaiensis TaxID=342944 RepID=A0A419V8E6_9BACL|nr:type II toxin-antitoxin system prevent-host-death family antitoxin [Sinobaca qinghaiensis]RKD76332.1 antitoxin YefM [Sinobaca qinghaiensis]